MPTPSAAARAAESLRFTVVHTSLGLALVADGRDGLRDVLLGDDRDALVAELRTRAPRATLHEDDAALAPRVARVVACIDGTPVADLPLDPRGTPFQHRVWQALREIPAGATATYRAIAERLGVPTAARAVAQACAANPLAVVVPCHRVVRGDGALAGYRWGPDRKRALLDREAAALRSRTVNAALSP